MTRQRRREGGMRFFLALLLTCWLSLGSSSPAGASPAAPGAATAAPVAVADLLPDNRSVTSSVPDATPATPATLALSLAFGNPASKAVPVASAETAMALRIVLGLTMLALLPALLVCLTAFLRIIIVLSMLRHAVGMPETPPNTVLIGLALFMTLFTMSSVFEQINQKAFQPFMQNQLSLDAAANAAAQPLRAFMLRQTREQDMALMVELAKVKPPARAQDIGGLQLIPAFMLSELRAAFQIGFLVFLPFLLIDLIVSSILMALGMMMMPPTTIALPIKILMFVLIDGWGLLLRGLIGSFH